MSVVLLAGPSRSGKTVACKRTVELARAKGLRVEGLIATPVYRGTDKTAIRLVDVHTGQQRILARAHDKGESPRVGKWAFDSSGVAWGVKVLASVGACDLLVIDEVGPLELEQGLGLTNAISTLLTGCYRLAVVSARPSLLASFESALAGLEVSTVFLDAANRDQVPSGLVACLSGSGRAARGCSGVGREEQDGEALAGTRKAHAKDTAERGWGRRADSA